MAAVVHRFLYDPLKHVDHPSAIALAQVGELCDLAEQFGKGVPAKNKVVVVELLLEKDAVLLVAAEAVFVHLAGDSSRCGVGPVVHLLNQRAQVE